MTTSVSSQTQCCIAGGGPAGMMLGYLLARAGVRTVVLEKHGDFLRDFRGDTVHPSTLRVMDELGLLDAFLERPHQRLEVVGGWFGQEHVQLGDFRGLPERYAFIALMPQWEFLDFLAGEARKLPAFELRLRFEVTGLIEADGRFAGVRGHSPDGDFEVLADCTIGCDGRRSTVRDAAGLPVGDIGAPIDVLWFRVRGDPAETDSSLAAASRSATSSSPSTAATTVNAPSSSPRAAPTTSSATTSRRSAPRCSRRRRCSPPTSTTCARGTTSSCSPSASTG